MAADWVEQLIHLNLLHTTVIFTDACTRSTAAHTQEGNLVSQADEGPLLPPRRLGGLHMTKRTLCRHSPEAGCGIV